MTTNGQFLKRDALAYWIEETWIPSRAESDLFTLAVSESCVDDGVLERFSHEFALPDDFRYAGCTPTHCPIAVRIETQTWEGDPAVRTGAYLYHFKKTESDETVDLLVVGTNYTEQGHVLALACLPRSFSHVWVAFAQECERLKHALEPESRVVVIGGRMASFVPTIDWDEIILAPSLKQELMEDVRSFFTKGVEVYKRLNLKPFRKLLMAGVPGTGKTMLCSAMAKWALEQNYLVIYVSSADQHGAGFWKIEQALSVAARSQVPALIILEEIDAYLRPQEKALVLNVLDGAESALNDWGTLLITTTNYPEAIDERVLKRPGRLDRIFIIPETRSEEEAEQMLRRYLGGMWRDEHRAITANLVGYPGAFIREVAVYALTQVAYDDLPELSLDLLKRSFEGLKQQIETRDNFLRQKRPQGLAALHANGRQGRD